MQLCHNYSYAGMVNNQFIFVTYNFHGQLPLNVSQFSVPATGGADWPGMKDKFEKVVLEQ